MRVVVLFFLHLMFCSYKPSKHVILIDKVTAAFKKDIWDKKVHFCGSGGRMMNDVEQVFLAFEVMKKSSLPEIRKLFIELTELYLNKVNNDVAVRPYLHNYPFTIDNLEFVVKVLNEKNCWQEDGNIAFVFYSKRRGVMIYQAHDSKNGLYTIYEEPYEEAVRLVKEGVES